MLVRKTIVGAVSALEDLGLAEKEASGVRMRRRVMKLALGQGFLK